uniref:Reverse transcriptase Ty1/copia-type domain-containing protein n=1 Tax=Ananas comosus var. bracteatus TaxID=296719 RepID=A0A6V7QCZ1_ANACO|nr:unnamed protein product [Ananas comosus var. bracteatus]
MKEEAPAMSTLHMQELSSSLTPERLDGTNYTEWSLNAENKIRGRKRWGFISGKKVAPEDKDSEDYETWEDENCMVKSWLLDAMNKDIRSLFIRLPTAKEIWDTAKKTYSVSQDASRAYQLYCEITSVRQNGGSVISYFGKLQRLWQELDAIENCTMECSKDIEKYTTKVNSQRVYVFLAGLDSHLDGVRGRILATIPLPDIQTVYANVCAETNRQEAMLHRASNEGAAMIAKKSSKKGIRKCTYCNGDNHLVETCFKLHGYPEWHPKGKSGSKIESSKNNLAPTTAAGLMAKSGISNSAYSSSVLTRTSDWIIDTGATDHMTCDRSKFTNLSSNNSKPVIANANGISSPVTGVGTVLISPSLSVSNVLFVPSLNCNLLSVSQLTKSHNCVVIFFPTHCVLQNIHTKAKIGSGKRSGDLYYLEGVTCSLLQRGNENDEVQNRNIQDIILLDMVAKVVPNVTSTESIECSTETQNNDGTRHPTPIPLIQSTPENSLEVSFDHELTMHETDIAEILDTPSPTPSSTPVISNLHENTCASDSTSIVSQYHLPSRSNRGQPPIRYEPDLKSKAKYPIGNHVSSHKLSRSYAFFVSQLSAVSIPSNLQEALADSRWTQAMEEEMAALKRNTTWELVPLPTGKKSVGCRWIFTVKYKADGTIERYKARLVAKGYTQSYGLDYQETFAPVAKLNTVRVLLSLAANQNWPLLQFDVKNAFLHGELSEEVYMDHPPGIPEYLNTPMVCRLKKALYGLKQSPRAWFGRFTKSMKNFGYKQSNSDHTLFLRQRQGKITALIIYVDDMIVTGDDYDGISSLQNHLASEFEMKQLGDLKYFLGIEVARSKHGIFLSQRKYTMDLLSETVERILRYLKSTPGKGILFSNHGHLKVEGYTDADWAGSADNRRSTSGYLTFVGGNLVTWRSKKQPVVARSSAEAEFRGMTFGLCELLWLKNLLKELGFGQNEAMKLHCDNTSAIEIAHNPVQHDRTKHVEIDRHFIKEKLEAGIITFPFVRSEHQLADVLTKAVAGSVLDDSIVKLGMCDIHAPT